ncbi:uncharacterized protein LOC110853403 isoform X2 [Folsomia candida]|uniref:uncharacterized protein LOC110853403 isoform X2 n=1 Tax=Folsomia candida TaxID=158441 RepID=UPI001604E8EF|nr:uncharacterized protein LOC110853403 isoform X2 [Folsomia candida]
MGSPIERYGYGKGIQGRDNSCYLDTTLMALFYGGSTHHRTFHIYQVNQDIEPTIVSATITSLSVIVANLRNTTRAGSELIQNLRRVLYSVNSKMIGEMMDVEEFVTTLCKKGMNLPPFIHYLGGSSNYYHQLILGQPPSLSPPVGKLQSLLEISLRAQSLTIESVPVSLFLVKMPRANGKLIGYRGIIPPLSLRVPIGSGGHKHQDFHLQAVITLRYCHYTCFIRSKKEWVYFDSMAPGGQPEVVFLNDMEQEVDAINRMNADDPTLFAITGNDSKSRKMLVTRLLPDIHFCIYANSQDGKEYGFINPNVSSNTQQLPRPPTHDGTPNTIVNRNPVTVPPRSSSIVKPRQAIAQPGPNRDPRVVPPQPLQRGVVNTPQTMPQPQLNVSSNTQQLLRPPGTSNTIVNRNPVILPPRSSSIVKPRQTIAQPGPNVRNPPNIRPHASPQSQIQTRSTFLSSNSLAAQFLTNFLRGVERGFTSIGVQTTKMMENVTHFITITIFTYDLNNSMDEIGDLRRLQPDRMSQVERIGENKGFKTGNGSNFALESLLFAIFSNTRINDDVYVQTRYADSRTRTCARLLEEVVDQLRSPPFLCSKRAVPNLMTAMREKCAKFRENNIGVDKTLSLLFAEVFATVPFIQWKIRTSAAVRDNMRQMG